MRKTRTSVWTLLAVLCALCSVAAKTSRVDWVEIRPNFWIAKHQKWGQINFSAIKFHLGYYRVRLVDVETYRDEHVEAIRRLNEGRSFSNNLLDSGIGIIAKTWPEPEDILAVAPAGWSRNLRSVQQVGLLIVNSKYYTDYDDRQALSAILCLDSPSYKGYDYQLPTFYVTSDDHQIEKAETCRDAVQVGPRIIEDPDTKRPPRGIDSREIDLHPSARVIFAVDQPYRAFPKDKPNVKLRENARDAFIIVTENDVHLLDVQEMLLSSDFYGQGADPSWAVNMAGGGPSGLVVTYKASGQPVVIGNPSGIIGSALIVTPRKF